MSTNEGDARPEQTGSADHRPMTQDPEYIEYLVDKKFFKRYMAVLRWTVGIFGVLLSALAYFGFDTYQDLSLRLENVKTAETKITRTYEDLLRRDSLRAYEQENGQYFSSLLMHDRQFGDRIEISDSLTSAGFGSINAQNERRYLKYLYERDGYYKNPAYVQTTRLIADSVDGVHISCAYWDVPAYIRHRIDSIFNSVYPGAMVEWYPDDNLPSSGFVYCIAGYLEEHE